MNDIEQIKDSELAAPGAGLPWPELQVARLMFRWQFFHSDRESAAKRIVDEERAILDLAARCDDSSGTARVLIRRLPGMEDSSRNWSVFMTLQHLAIVNELVAETITLLGDGKVPERVASTATVKPDPSANASTRDRFAQSCQQILDAANGIRDLRTKARYVHPWFGPLDASAWHFMAGFHMRLHAAQITTILNGI